MRVPILVRAQSALATVAIVAGLHGLTAGASNAQQPTPRRTAPATTQPQGARRPPAARPAQAKPLSPVEQRIRAIENGLIPTIRVKGQPATGMTLAARMKKYRVQGVSIAVINDYEIEWAKGYGVASGRVRVDTTTPFRAGAATEVVTALAALRLAQNKRLDLNKDINKSLKIWKLPKTDYTRRVPVTPRALLAHSAGLSITAPSAYAAGAPLPSITQVLYGTPPAISKAVVSRETPGESNRYTTADYAVVQQLLEDAGKTDFATLATESVLRPLGMSQSGFFQVPVDSFAARAAAGHDAMGKPIPGKWRVYPELGAVGLWSTPADLAKVIVEIQVASGGREGKVLRPDFADMMLAPEHMNWPGLGVALEGRDAGARFRASGATEGFVTEVVGLVERGQGAVVMINTAEAGPLAEEILNAIAAAYQWPGYVMAEKVVAKVDPKVYTRFVGKYAADSREVSVARRGNKLFIGPAGKETTELMPESVSDFFSADPAAVYSFVFDEAGKVQAFTQRGRSGYSRWDRKS